VQEQLDRYPRNAIPDFRNFSVDILPHLQMAMSFPLLPRSGIRSATWRTTTSIGPSAATGLEVSADTAGGIPRYGITRRGGNNDLLSTLWREVISLAGVARSFLSGGGHL
jgi:hypothetical protein